MKQQKTMISRIAADMFTEQLKWSVWFISIILLLHIVAVSFISDIENNINNLFGFSYFSTPVFMLVIAIISGSLYLPFYVRYGVTRKEYYIGATLGAFGLSVALSLIFAVLSLIENVIYRLFDIQMAMDPVAVNMQDNWLFMIGVYILNVFAYYLIGWLINASFYHFGWLIGMGFILLSIAIATLHGFLWGDGLAVVGSNLHDFYKVDSTLIAIFGTLALVGVMLFLIRFITKKVAIKI
jgi:hypothetical protein